MRSLSILLFASAFIASPHQLAAQEDADPVATLFLADGSSVALLDWKLSYEFVTWGKKEPMSSARTSTHESHELVLGKKTYPLKGETLTLTRVDEDRDSVRVVSMNLKATGDLKLENPAQDALVPDLEKDRYFQPRSVDIMGKTLSGISRSFCVASFSALVECGMTKTTRVVRIAFN